MENSNLTTDGVNCSSLKKSKIEKLNYVYSNGTTKGAMKENGTNQHYFLTELFELMLADGLDKAKNRENKIIEFKHPKELKKLLDLDITQPTSDDQLLLACEDIIKYSVKTGHPRFFNQLFGGVDEYTLGGSWLTETLNTSQYTYEVAPVFILIEETIIKKLLTLAGFTEGDGIFCPGGSIANMYALNLARYQKFPDIKSKGMHALPRICILTSEKGHYSLIKGAAFIGLGTDNVIAVATDNQGRMSPEALEQSIIQCKKKGMVPYLVNATGGSTVLGAYDPLPEIADICQNYKIWLHVDGSWGAAALLSDRYKHYMKGVERADSLTWNPHKMLGGSVQAATFLTKHKSLLLEAHSAQAKYLFQQDKFYDVSYDIGDKSIQCSRKVDALKIWTKWKSKGDSGMAAGIDHLFECSRYLAKLVNMTEGFRLVQEPQCTNVCFWYIPKRFRGQLETSEWWEQLGKVAPEIKQRMVEKGTLFIGYQPDGDLVNFFRMIFNNMDVLVSDVDFLVEEIDRLGCDL